MKYLKQKLMAATAMLMVSAVMLTGVSYAWFTMSTNPEVSGMTATVTANENLEIALDNGYADEAAVNTASQYGDKEGVQGSTTGNPYTWGNVIDLTEAFKAIENIPEGKTSSSLNLQPVKYTPGTTDVHAATFQYPLYGTDGRITELAAATPTLFSDYSNVVTNAGTNQVKLAGGVKAYGVSSDGGAAAGPYYAYSVTYWLRSNVAGKIVLQTDAAERADDETTTLNADGDADADADVNTVMGKGSYIKIPNFGTVADTGKTETQQAIIAYLSNLKIRFVTGNKTVDATINETPKSLSEENFVEYTENDAYFTLSMEQTEGEESGESSVVTLERNVAQKVTMYVYIDGETINNEDALLSDIPGVEFNIQFTHEKIGTDDGQTGSGAMDADTYAEDSSEEEDPEVIE